MAEAALARSYNRWMADQRSETVIARRNDAADKPV
jgi:hypothetical protein